MIPAREQPGQAARWAKARWERSSGGRCAGGRTPRLTVGVGLVELVVLLLGASLHPQGRPLRREQPHTAMSPFLARGHLHFRSVTDSSPVPREQTAAESTGSGRKPERSPPRAHPSQITWTESHVPGGHERGVRSWGELLGARFSRPPGSDSPRTSWVPSFLPTAALHQQQNQAPFKLLPATRCCLPSKLFQESNNFSFRVDTGFK